jgi:gliding motility-associated-like protein
LIDSFYNLSTAAKKWQWNFGDDSPFSADLNPVHTYSDTGTYKVWLTVYNEHGCKDSLEENVVVAPQFKFFIPNAFRPNGNSKNDIFYGYGLGIKEYNMSIFDRWGEKIFESTDIKNGWNGIVQNQKVQEDVYVYLVVIKDIFKKMHRYSGTVTVLK